MDNFLENSSERAPSSDYRCGK